MSRIILNQIALQKIKVISETKKYFLLQPSSAAAPSTSNYGITPPTYTQTGYSGWSDTEPSYTVGDERVLYELTETIYSDRTWDYSIPTVSSSYEAAKEAYNEAIQAEEDIQDFVDLGLKQGYIWDNPTSKPASGTVPAYPAGSYIASGTLSGGARSINRSNSNTYGLNTWISTGGINLRYNAIDLMKLTTSNLFFYYPSTSTQQKKAISLGTNGTVNSLAFYGFNNNNKTMELTNNALTFYNPSNGTDKLATLNANGLVLSKGGITVDTVGSNDGMYISSENLGSVVSSLVPTPSGGTPKTNWRAVIGSKFGVDSEGNLYANEAHISGEITASKLTINSNATISDTSGLIRNDAVDIGGRNLFGHGSDCSTTLDGMTNQGFEIVTEDGFNCAHASGEMGVGKYLQSKIPFYPKANEVMTISAWVKIKNIVYGTGNPSSMCEFYTGGQTIDGSWRSYNTVAVYLDGVKANTQGLSHLFTNLISDTNWHKVDFVLKWQNYAFTINVLPSVYLRNATGDLYVRHIKYERGNKATDWTPAPEDVQNEIDAKKSIHTLDSSYSETYAQLLAWSKEGYDAGQWAVSSTAGVAVGDTVRIKCLVSNMNNAAVYVLGTVTTVTSATILRMKSHGLDTTIIDGGNILTNSITANQLNVSNIQSNVVQTAELNADMIKSGKLQAEYIQTSGINIGMSQVTDLNDTLDTKTNNEDFSDTVESISASMGSLNGLVSSSTTNLTQNLNDATAQLASLRETYENDYSKLSSFILTGEEVDGNVHTPYILLGTRNDGDFIARITNEKFQLGINNSSGSDLVFHEIAYLSPSEVKVTNQLSFGNFAFYQRTNGHFSLKFTGGVD